MGAVALALGLAVTMTPAGALAPAGEAHAATTSALESSAATAATNRVSQDVQLSEAANSATYNRIKGSAPLSTDGDIEANGSMLYAEARSNDGISTYAQAENRVPIAASEDFPVYLSYCETNHVGWSDGFEGKDWAQLNVPSRASYSQEIAANSSTTGGFDPTNQGRLPTQYLAKNVNGVLSLAFIWGEGVDVYSAWAVDGASPDAGVKWVAPADGIDNLGSEWTLLTHGGCIRALKTWKTTTFKAPAEFPVFMSGAASTRDLHWDSFEGKTSDDLDSLNRPDPHTWSTTEIAQNDSSWAFNTSLSGRVDYIAKVDGGVLYLGFIYAGGVDMYAAWRGASANTPNYETVWNLSIESNPQIGTEWTRITSDGGNFTPTAQRQDADLSFTKIAAASTGKVYYAGSREEYDLNSFENFDESRLVMTNNHYGSMLLEPSQARTFSLHTTGSTDYLCKVDSGSFYIAVIWNHAVDIYRFGTASLEDPAANTKWLRSDTGEAFTSTEWVRFRDVVNFTAEEYFDIAFDEQGGSSTNDAGDIAAFPSISSKVGENVTLPNYNGAKLGYSFAGWDTQSDGKGLRYTNGKMYGPQTDPALAGSSGQTITLYAIWPENNLSLTYYSAEGGATTVEDADYSGKPGYSGDQDIVNNRVSGQNSYTQKENEVTLTNGLSKVLDAVDFECAGHDFDGWVWKIPGTTATGTVDDQDADLITTLLKDTTNYDNADRQVELYAKWKLSTYTVTFDGGGLDVSIDGTNYSKFKPKYDSWTVDPANSNKWTAPGQTWTDNGNDTYTATFNYRTGLEFPNKANAYRTGYVFNKWYDSSDGNKVSVTAISPGTVDKDGTKYVADFTVKTYRVNYDLTHDGTAYGEVDTSSGVTVKEEAVGGSTAKILYTSFGYTDIAAAGGAGLAPAAGNKGYTFANWSAESSAPGDPQTGKTLFQAVTTECSGTPDAADIRLLLWPGDDGLQSDKTYDYEKANAQPSAVSVHPVWASAGTTAVVAASSHPSANPADGEQVMFDTSEDGQATVQQDLAYWPGHGIAAKKDTSYVEGADAGATAKDAEIPVAPLKRTGYTFAGWGVPLADAQALEADTIAEADRIAYDKNNDVREEHGQPNEGAQPGESGQPGKPGKAADCHNTADGDKFVLYVVNDNGTPKLTQSGANLVAAWEARTNDDNDLADSSLGIVNANWQAVWQADEYAVTLRIPTSALSTSSEIGDKYDRAKWVNWSDGNSGWMQATLNLHYWDEVWIPYFAPNGNSFTFDGWYDAREHSDESDGRIGTGQPSSRAAGGTYTNYAYIGPVASATEQAPAGYKFDTTKIDNTTAQTLRANDASGTKVADITDTNRHDRDIWLGYTTVKVGVTAPLFVYLCEETKCGHAVGDPVDDGSGNTVAHSHTEDCYVEPAYAVGTDGRKLLEAKVNFTTTSTTSHDFKVSKVECITGSDSDGTLYASDLLRPYSTAADSTDSRFFWLSTESTVKNSESGNGWVSTDNDPDDSERRYFGIVKDKDNTIEQSINYTGEGENRKLVTSELEGKVDLENFVVSKPGSDNEGAGDIDDSVDGVRTTTFYYGLNLNRAYFDKAATVEAFEGGGVQSVRLARLVFTFSPLAH